MSARINQTPACQCLLDDEYAEAPLWAKLGFAAQLMENAHCYLAWAQTPNADGTICAVLDGAHMGAQFLWSGPGAGRKWGVLERRVLFASNASKRFTTFRRNRMITRWNGKAR